MRHPLDLFSWQGRVSRGEYVLAGTVLFAIKYAIDSGVAALFGRPWNPLMYVSPRVSPLLQPGADATFWVALLAVALPFIAAGVSLTARRLRDAGIHPFWCGLFFMPFAHFAAFLALAVMPSAGAVREDALRAAPIAATRRFARKGISPGGRFLLGLGASVVFGLVGFLFATAGRYGKIPILPGRELLGLGLFVGTPFGMGFWPGYVIGFDRREGRGLAVGCAVTSVLVSLVLLLATGAEGVGCLVMAFPILAALAIVGAFAGWLCTRTPELEAGALLGLLVPGLLLGRDASGPPELRPYAVVSTVTVKAPPEVVWRNVVSFPPIDAPADPLFAIVAMPLEARIDGRDPGATRRCVFTIGEFEEPIVRWDEPRELTFRVRRQPESIDRLIEVEKGQFLLTGNADGTTTIRGTTWYRLKTAPFAYWSRWSGPLMHAIHMRVLEHVKRLSERPDLASGPPTRLPSWIAAADETCECTRPAPR